MPVEIIQGSLAGGMEINEVVKEDGLEREDVLAALEYAAKIVAGEEIRAYARSKYQASFTSQPQKLFIQNKRIKIE